MTRDYLDIPGTYVFDIKRSQMGYPVNKFCESLNTDYGREQFLNNEDEYLRTFGMSEEQIQAIKDRDLNKILELGGNIYYVFKIGAVLGLSIQSTSGMMAEPKMTEAEFQAMMLKGGRSIEGNRSIKENEKRSKDG
ncbi:MAG: protocatechuate 4,5-dioxygenase subunit alpha [Campylobacteraceae bacterium]|nr:protocatechuate 4,5-dioxygenase subunit alpha [Campylobacteraceae bacterium]